MKNSDAGEVLYLPPDSGLPPQYFAHPIAARPGQVETIFISNRSYLNFTGAFVLSCCVFWCCVCLYGLIAFILAAVGQNAVANGDGRSARPMLTVPYIVSAVKAVVGIILIIDLPIMFVVLAKEIVRLNTNN